MRRITHTLVLGILAAVAAPGCEHAGPLEAEGVLEPTLSSIQENIFSTSCALSGCHLGGSAPLGLDLSEGRARDNLVDVPSAEVPELMRVEPGNPEDSYLVIKLEGSARLAPGTGRMPLGRSPLSPEQIRVVREWIAAGAP